jgi:hypothetical protein
MSKPYVVVASKFKGVDAIKLTEQPWEGIIYSYGKVNLEEDEEADIVRLKFDYEVHDYNNKTLTDKKPFETYIGNILEELIHEGLAENNLTYTGGVDENRTEDSSESDL